MSQTVGPFPPAYIETLLVINRGVEPLRDAPVVRDALFKFHRWGLIRGPLGEEFAGGDPYPYVLTAAGRAVIAAWERPLTITAAAEGE